MSTSKGLFVSSPSRKIFSAQKLARVILVCLLAAAFLSLIALSKMVIERGDESTFRLPKDSIAEIGLQDLKEPAFLRLPVGTAAAHNAQGFSR